MQLIKDLANTLGMPGEENENILINRCGFNSKGFLSRLYLNGLDLRGSIDLSDYTKHLTVLDIRNNPELQEVRISSLSLLASVLDSETKDYCCEALKLNKGQTVTVVDSSHDINESPFAHFFLENDDEELIVTHSADALPHASRSGLSEGIRITPAADMYTQKARLALESDLLQTAVIGRELTSCLQDRFDRTGIGMLNRGLKQLRALAADCEQDRFIRQSIKKIKSRCSHSASPEAIREMCSDFADKLWSAERNGVILSDHLIAPGRDLPVNCRNYGKSGKHLIDNADRSDTAKYLHILQSARDDHITGAGYGKCHLRLQAERYTDLVTELSESVDDLNSKLALQTS